MKTLVVLFLVVHGLIHFLGVAKAFQWAALPQLTQPISPAGGLLWLGAGVLFLAAAAAFVVWPRSWWVVGAAAVVVSFAAIAASWTDARAGAVANVVVVLFVVAGFLMDGPGSQRVAYEQEVARALAHARPGPLVTETDLARLPAPVQRYLRQTGVVGHPRPGSVRARLSGRIRSGPDARWMTLRAEQHNVFDEPSRFFYMEGTTFGLPFRGLHRFVGPSATMLVKVAGVVPVAQGAGSDMDQAETVTLFNDMCVLAPATLADSSIAWEPAGDRAARAAFTHAGRTIRAELAFNDRDELVDFWSDDRRRLSANGAAAPIRWSTPIGAYRRFGPFRLASRGEGRWHAPDGTYTYIDLAFDEITYDAGPP